MSYKATKQQVYNRRIAPDDFLDQLVAWGQQAPDEIFAPNSASDIYSSVYNTLGPWQGDQHRRAVMLEVLRVLAGFESSWHWNAGKDPGNHSDDPMTFETGAWQVSANSMNWGQELKNLVQAHLHTFNVQAFQDGMKSDHPLAIEYIARLLRRTTQANGPVERHEIDPWLRTNAVEEFRSLLQPDRAGTGADGQPVEAFAGATVPSTNATDKSRIPSLLELADNATTLDSAQQRAAQKLRAYDGEVYPQDGCAITLSTLLQDAEIGVPDIYQAITLGRHLRDKRKWQVIPVGQQQVGDVGSTCGDVPKHGNDHIYLVLQKLNADEMLIADNQKPVPHFRFASGQGRTPTMFFLRAT
jgi:hypothetical protein